MTLEKLLQKKSPENLFQLWKTHKTPLREALDKIATSFPYYTRHDASHSEAILDNIYRLLGPKQASKLEALDIWLLLEAAYRHDLGMILRDGEKTPQKLIADFRQEIGALSQNTSHELVDVAKNFLDASEKFTGNDLDNNPGIAPDDLTQLISYLYRQRHAIRSQHFVEHPEELALPSFTDKIHKRIVIILGEICRLHTAPFAEVQDLNPSQDGMPNMGCFHPRFIACLLRVGDSLDFDNNRFSAIGKKLWHVHPVTAGIHDKKHQSLRTKNIEPELVQAEAYCCVDNGDYAVFNESKDWFSRVRNHFIDIERHHDAIVPPSSGIKILPKVELKTLPDNGYIMFDNTPPDFVLNKVGLFSRLVDKSLYGDKYLAIRELLQNAVDATLIRLWCEFKNLMGQLHPNHPDFCSLCEQFPIHIDIDIDTASSQMLVKIRDSGIGIKEEDCRYMLHVGGPAKNYHRSALIEEMPVWLRPSGCFGIGLHSVFGMGATVLNYRSISSPAGPALIFQLISPLVDSSTGSFIRKEDRKSDEPVGTVCQFSLKYSSSAHDKEIDVAKKIFGDEFIDTVSDEDRQFMLQHILQRVHGFSRFSPLPVKIFLKGKEIPTETRLSENPSPKAIQGYDSTNQIFLSGVFDFPKDDEPLVIKQECKIEILFRGQSVGSVEEKFGQFSGTADLYGFRADEILTLDRNSLLDGAETIISQKIIDAFVTVANNGERSEREKALLSAVALRAMNYRTDGRTLYGKSWQQCNVTSSMMDSTTFEDLLKHDCIAFCKEYVSEKRLRIDDFDDHIPDADPIIESFNNSITVEIADHGLFLFEKHAFALSAIQSEGYGLVLENYHGRNHGLGTSFTLKRMVNEKYPVPFSPTIFAVRLLYYFCDAKYVECTDFVIGGFTGAGANPKFGKQEERVLVPVWGDFDILSLRPLGYSLRDTSTDHRQPRLLLPLVSKGQTIYDDWSNNSIDALVDWTCANSFYGKVDPTQIKMAYDKLIRYIDKILMPQALLLLGAYNFERDIWETRRDKGYPES